MLAVLALPAMAVGQGFDVVSIKPQKWTGQGSVGISVRGNTLYGEHVSLDDLVMFAYDLRGVQLSGGPAWAERRELMSSELYQVTAKVSSDPPPPLAGFRKMLQPVLAERFHLQLHHVQKELPVYNLVIAKDGPTLKPSQAESKYGMSTTGLGNYGIRIVATKCTIQQLVDYQLSGYASRPVFDKTGLAEPYDFTFEFVSENAPPGQDAGAMTPLVTGIQEQLGLKLEPATAPFDTIVIDRAERPSEN